MSDVGTGTERAQFKCLSCISKGRKTTTGPSREKEKDFTICHQCASDNAMAAINGCRASTEKVLRKAEGSAREFVENILELFDKTGDIGEIWSGTKTGGRGSYKLAEFRASDALALARLAVARPIYVVAQKVAERAAERLKDSQDPQALLYLEGIEGYVAYVGSRLRSAGNLIGAGFDGDINILRPKMLDLGPRRRFWSAARQSFETVNLLPSAIDGLVTGDLGIDDFHQRLEKAKDDDHEVGDTAPKTPAEGPKKTAAEDSDAEQTAIEAIVGLTDEVRIIKPGKRTPVLKKEQDRAKRLLKEHGGLLDLSWGSGSNGKKPKIVKLSGCETDPEAAKAAMLAKVRGE